MPHDVLDPATVLAAPETSVRTRRAAALEDLDLDLVLAWADLHGDDPQAQPGAIPVRYGGDQLIDLGGDGTPLVQDLCRLPQTFAVLRSLACEVWLACRVASMTAT